MRDWVMVGMLVATVPFALQHPWVGVLLWNWVSLMVPHRLAWGFATTAPFAAIAAGSTIIALFVTRDRVKMTWEPPVVALMLLVMWMCITTAAGFFPAESLDQLIKVLKIQLMTFIAFAVLQNRKHIELFIWVNVLSVGFYGFKGGIFTIQTAGGSRVWGPPGGFIEDNNALAVALVMTIPLMHYLRVTSRHAWVRMGLLMLMLLTAVSVLGSQSRGALLAIGAMCILMWLRLKKKVVAGIVMVVVGVSLIAFMPKTWEDRMSTMQTYEEDRSANERLIAWQMTINLANSRPWGGGFEIYNRTVYDKYYPDARIPQAAHSIYFSMLGEHGYPGLILFVMAFGLAFGMANRLRREAALNAQTAWVGLLAGMCQVSIVGYAVGGAFLSLAYYDFAYNIIVILVVTNRWMAERRWVDERVGAFGAGLPGEYVGKPTPAIGRA